MKAMRLAEASEKLRGLGFDQTRDLTPAKPAFWDLARRTPGRPHKSAEEKSARVLVTLAPKLLAEADGCAKRQGISRAELIARGLAVVLTKDRNDRKNRRMPPRRTQRNAARLLPRASERLYHVAMSEVAKIKNAAGGLVVSNPAILGGTPVFRGTRLPVQTLFDYPADGLSLSYFLETFEGVTREHAQAVLRYGCDRIFLELGQSYP